MRRLFGILICMVMLFALFCGPAAGAGEKIYLVSVKGNRRIETAAILNVLKLKAGDQLDAAKVDEDIHANYNLGYFQDVKAVTENDPKGVVLTYVVREKPIVREVRIDGNKEIKTEKIRDAIEVKLGSVFTPEDLAKSVNKIKKLYADDGYYLAKVETTIIKSSPTDVRVVFKINEGEKVLIRKILFEGNKAFSDRKLKKVMNTSEKWFLSWLTGAGTYKEDVLKNDVNLITDLYYDNGYANVKVGEPKVELTPDRKGLIITIGITEGPQFRTGAIGFKGDLLESEDALRKNLKLKSGDIFNRSLLRKDIFTLTDIYADKGYAFANVTPLSKMDEAKKTIDITYDFDKGEKVYIDRINISGNTKTRDKVVRRELKLAEGDLYSATALRKSKQDLMNTGFFEEANISTAKGSADNKLDLDVKVKEKSTGTFSIGAGYSSLDGIMGQGSIQQSNFRGLGLKANASVSFGTKTQFYNIGLTDPYFMDTRWTLGGDLYRTQRDYIDYTRRATGADIKGGYTFNDELSTLWIYKFEQKKIFDESEALKDNIAKGLLLQPETSSTTSSITASISQNTTDYHLDPTTGMINNLSIEFAGLGGSNRFVRYLADSTYFHPAFWDTVFSLHGSFGYIEGMGREIPIDEKFYLGGINTLRGYAGRTVSPYVSSTVFVPNINGVNTGGYSDIYAFIGGDTEAYFNFEYKFPLVKDAGLKGVLFFDAGDSYNGIDNIFSRIQASYGFGIRWSSPMGPLRLEYGIPLNPRSGIDKSSGRIEFSIGSFF